MKGKGGQSEGLVEQTNKRCDDLVLSDRTEHELCNRESVTSVKAKSPTAVDPSTSPFERQAIGLLESVSKPMSSAKCRMPESTLSLTVSFFDSKNFSPLVVGHIEPDAS